MKHICPVCKIEKEWDSINFYKDASRKNKLETYCKKCRNEKQKKSIIKCLNREKIIIIEKECSRCGELKKIKEYYKEKRTIDGYQVQCKECRKKQNNLRFNTLGGCIINILKNTRKRAKKKEMEYNLTNKFIHKVYHKQNGLCALSNMKMNTESGHETYRVNPYRISIDRIVSSKGYTQDNIQLVCAKINSMKNEMDQDEFIEICGQIYKQRELV